MNREERQKWQEVLRAAYIGQAEGRTNMVVNIDLLIAAGKALEESERPQTTALLTEAARQGFYGSGTESTKG